MPSFPLPRSGVTMTPRTETTRPACPVPGNDACIAANALLLPPVELSAMTPLIRQDSSRKKAARPARHLPSCGAKRFRRPRLSPRSPLRASLRTPSIAELSAQPQSVELPAPADLNLSFWTGGSGARKRRSSAASPKNVSTPPEITEDRGRQEPGETSGALPTSGSVRRAHSRRARTNEAACADSARRRNRRRGRHGRVSATRLTQRRGHPPAARGRTPRFSLLLHHAPGIPAPKLSPRLKTIFALPASRRGKPIGTRPFAPWALRRDAGERSTRPRCYSRRCRSALSFRRRSEIYGRSKRRSPGYAESPSRRSGL